MAFWIPAAIAASTILGNLAKGRAEGRKTAADTNLSRDQVATQQWQAAQNAALTAKQAGSSEALAQGALDLNQRQFALDAPTTRGKQAVRGDVMAGMQDVSVSHPRANVVNVSGGLRPSLLSPESRELGRTLTRQALLAQMAGDEFAPMEKTDFESALRPAPGLTPLPQANTWDKILGVAAPLAGLAAEIGKMLPEGQTGEEWEEIRGPSRTVANRLATGR